LATESTHTKAAQVAQHCMTAQQFDQHFMPLMGCREGSKRTQALRMVLVEGVTGYEAAKRVQVDTASVTKAITEAREIMDHVAALQYPAVRMPPTREQKQSLGS
jgi:hypothetical protein